MNMFYEENSVNLKLICLNCQQRFNIPKLLPCGESICEECLSKLLKLETKISCPYCKLIHECNSYPTQKLLIEILNLNPVKVYRGEIFAKTDLLLNEARVNLQNLNSTLINKIHIISVNSCVLREKIVGNQFEITKIDVYENECYINLKKYFSLQDKNEDKISYFDAYFKQFINNINKKLVLLQFYLSKADLNDKKIYSLFQIISYIHINIKITQNYLNSILFNLNNESI